MSPHFAARTIYLLKKTVYKMRVYVTINGVNKDNHITCVSSVTLHFVVTFVLIIAFENLKK